LDGKRVASMNARSHGLFCRDLILPGENREAFIELWNSIQSTLRAKNLLELSLVSRFVQAQWKLLRLQSAEAALHEVAQEEILEKSQKQILKLMNERESYRCQIDEHLETFVRTQLQRTQKKIDEVTQENLPAGRMLAESLRSSGGACSGARERLSCYEQRIEASGMRALSMLLKLREQMKEQTSDPGEEPLFLLKAKIADDPSPEQAVDEMQNEPTEDESSATDALDGGCDSIPCGLGVPPELGECEGSSGGTPKPRTEEADAPAEGDPAA
jgi:hypothetical protein